MLPLCQGTEMSSPGSHFLKSFLKSRVMKASNCHHPTLQGKPTPPRARISVPSGRVTGPPLWLFCFPILSELETFFTYPSFPANPPSGLYSCLSQRAFSLPLFWSLVMSAGNMTVGGTKTHTINMFDIVFMLYSIRGLCSFKHLVLDHPWPLPECQLPLAMGTESRK